MKRYLNILQDENVEAPKISMRKTKRPRKEDDTMEPKSTNKTENDILQMTAGYVLNWKFDDASQIESDRNRGQLNMTSVNLLMGGNKETLEI